MFFSFSKSPLTELQFVNDIFSRQEKAKKNLGIFNAHLKMLSKNKQENKLKIQNAENVIRSGKVNLTNLNNAVRCCVPPNSP